jgi:hypothetical protein
LLGDALTEGLTEADGDCEDEGLADMEGETLGLMLLEMEAEGDCEELIEGLIDALGLTDAEIDADAPAALISMVCVRHPEFAPTVSVAVANEATAALVDQTAQSGFDAGRACIVRPVTASAPTSVADLWNPNATTHEVLGSSSVASPV